MLLIEFSNYANHQIDDVLSNNGIYNNYGHFTQRFINWNSEFHRYVNPNVIITSMLSNHGWYKIGSIGTLEYKYFTVEDAEIFEIIEFRFTKLPYTKSKCTYTITGDAGYGYKIIQSTLNKKYTILTPKRTQLTKFAFDAIIGFHHSSDDYNKVHAIGFIGDRTYSIEMNSNVTLLPYSRKEYLSMKHKFYESRRRATITKTQIKKIITEVIKEIYNIA